MKWEYKSIQVAKEIILSDLLNTFGEGSWELIWCDFNINLLIFKRPKPAGTQRQRTDARQIAFGTLAELSKRDDQTSKEAANFIRNTLGIANTIENQGWDFAAGHDLIKDILHPSFRNFYEELNND